MTEDEMRAQLARDREREAHAREGITEAQARLDVTLDKYEAHLDKVEAQYAQVLEQRGQLDAQELEVWRPTLKAPGGVQSLFHVSEQKATTDEQRARIDAVLARHQAGLRATGTF